MKVTRNFDFDKLMKSKALSEWLNQYGNRINKSIQDGLNNATDIAGKRFKSGSDFTHKSIHDGHAHRRPLVRSGRLKESVKKFPSTSKKLTFIIKSSVKSKARWNIKVDGSKSSGTRGVRGVNYGAMLNKGFKTSKDSLIPNKTVKQREWFGIPKPMLPNGVQWFKFAKQFDLTFQRFLTTAMKKFGK